MGSKPTRAGPPEKHPQPRLQELCFESWAQSGSQPFCRTWKTKMRTEIHKVVPFHQGLQHSNTIGICIGTMWQQVKRCSKPIHGIIFTWAMFKTLCRPLILVGSGWYRFPIHEFWSSRIIPQYVMSSITVITHYNQWGCCSHCSAIPQKDQPHHGPEKKTPSIGRFKRLISFGQPFLVASNQKKMGDENQRSFYLHQRVHA